MTENISKIGIPCFEPGGLSSKVCKKFGRCDFFTIAHYKDNKLTEVEVINNPGAEAAGSAGRLAGNALVEKEVKYVIGGNCGPNALDELKTAGIEIYNFPEGETEISVKKVLDLFFEKKLIRTD